jgi:hypothetical protein
MEKSISVIYICLGANALLGISFLWRMAQRSAADLLAAPLGPTSRVFRRPQIWPNCEAHGVAAVKMDDDDEYFPDLTALHYPRMMLQK